jgi:hypothetical protein
MPKMGTLPLAFDFNELYIIRKMGNVLENMCRSAYIAERAQWLIPPTPGRVTTRIEIEA